MSLSAVDQVAAPVQPSASTAAILDQVRAASATITTPRRRALPWVKEIAFALRRGHLYAGLLLLPWVFLYGVTGFLFNHPTWFADVTVRTFGPAETAGTALAELPSPTAIAGQVVTALNARGGRDYRLVPAEDARYERGGLSATLLVGGKTYTASINADGAGGTVREAPAPTRAAAGSGGGGEPKAKGRGEGEAKGGGGAREPGKRAGRGEASPGHEHGEARRDRDSASAATTATAPFEVRDGLMLATAPLSQLQQGLPAVLARLGLVGAKVGEVRAAPLTFPMEGGGQRWVVSYTMATGAVAGRLFDATAASELSTRRFLTSLHMAHGYPTSFGSRWIWAVIVDIMSGIMVFWGISGLVMWWQIKRTRRLGAVLLGLSVVAAIAVGLGMHEALAAAGR